MSLVPYKVTALKRLDTSGLNIVPGATVSVTSGASYSQLWEEEAGTTPIANPFYCDNNGEREFWILPGEYLISVAGGQSWNENIGIDPSYLESELLARVQTVATFAALAATPAQAGQVFSTVDYDGAGFGSGLYVGKSGTATSGDPFQSASASGGVYLELINSIYSSDMIGNVDLELQIGSGEKYETLTEALSFASRYRCADGKILQLNLKAGFVLAEQVLFENTDFRHVLITSTDAVVTVARSAITETWRGIIPTFGFAKCFCPVFEVQFEMDTSGSDLDQYGIVIRSSFLRSEFGAGFRNAPLRNVECAWGSILDIRYGDFSGAGDTCIRVSNGSIGYLRDCKANDGGGTGVSVSNAWADFTDGEATGNYYAGVVPNAGGIIIVNNAIITDNVTSLSDSHGDITTDVDGKVFGYAATVGNSNSHAVYCDTGECSLDQLVVTEAGREALKCIGGGVIRAPGSNITGGTISATCTNSEIHLAGATFTNPTTGQVLFCSGGIITAQNSTTTTTGTSANSIFSGSDGATINLSKATCNNAPIQLFRFLRGCTLRAPSFTGTGSTISSGQLCRFDASEAHLSNSNLSGRTGGIGVQANLGSNVNLTNTNVLLSTAIESINDINIATGSIIHAHSSSGGLNVTANTLTAAGIIFDA